MLTDEALEEYAEILVESFFKNPTIAGKGLAYKMQALESLQKMLIANKNDVELSIMRFHDWIHKNGVGCKDYKGYKS